MGIFSFRKKENKAEPIPEPIHREIKEVSIHPALLIYMKIHGESPTYILSTDREFFIGRSPKNDLCLEGEDISDIHAKIRPEKDNYMLYNLVSSKNEIYVNWEKTLKHKLEHRDMIKIGSHVLVFKFINSEAEIFDGMGTVKQGRSKPVMTIKFLVSSNNKLEEFSGVVRDISFDGARIETERGLSKGNIIEVGISSVELPVIEVIAEVIWERAEDKGDKILYDVGLQFLEMDKASRKRLIDYLA